MLQQNRDSFIRTQHVSCDLALTSPDCVYTYITYCHSKALEFHLAASDSKRRNAATCRLGKVETIAFLPLSATPPPARVSHNHSCVHMDIRILAHPTPITKHARKLDRVVKPLRQSSNGLRGITAGGASHPTKSMRVVSLEIP